MQKENPLFVVGIAEEANTQEPVEGATITFYEEEIEFPRILRSKPDQHPSTITDSLGRFVLNEKIEFPFTIIAQKQKLIGSKKINDMDELTHVIYIGMHSVPRE